MIDSSLSRAIGGGGMVEVWAAADRQLGEEIAIKTIRTAAVPTSLEVDQFKREIQLARRIAHPNVCRVHELFEDRSGPAPRLFLTMELLEGETLAARLNREGGVPFGEALSIVSARSGRQHESSFVRGASAPRTPRHARSRRSGAGC